MLLLFVQQVLIIGAIALSLIRSLRNIYRIHKKGKEENIFISHDKAQVELKNELI